jgi:4-amino-4-deoxy-L-arabinose transferase-like glycosyltransferase
MQTSTLMGAVLLALALVSGSRMLRLVNDWQGTHGWEYLWIAESVAEGKGFSFPADHRWRFIDFESSYPSDEYFPTAHEEPVYPLFVGLFLKAFGEYGLLAVALLQVLALFLSAVLVYHLGCQVFNWQTGILAAGVLVMAWPPAGPLAERMIAPALFAGFLITLSAWLLVRCTQEPSIRGGIFLGATLGFSCLTFAPTLLFVPVSVLLLALSTRRAGSVAWKAALAVLLTVGIAMTPWSLRNLLVFNSFVPLKTGFWLIAHQSNPILASTFTEGSHACNETWGPVWHAPNAKEAIRLSSRAENSRAKRHAIYKRSYDCIEQEAPEGYEEFNEAEREKVYRKKTMEFVFEEPRTFAVLTYHRTLAFFAGWGRRQSLVALLAFLGAVLSLRNRRARALIPLILAYAIPFSLAAPWFYRYRYPIEPLLLLFAAYVPSLVLIRWNRLLFLHRKLGQNR